MRRPESVRLWAKSATQNYVAPLPGRYYCGFSPRANATYTPYCFMLAAIRIETVFIILVILNLIGLTIAAYVVLRKK